MFGYIRLVDTVIGCYQVAGPSYPPAASNCLPAVDGSRFLLTTADFEKGITAAWRSPNGGRNSKTGWELQNRARLPPIDRQAHDTHAHFFLPINFSANSAPQLILKILLVVSISVNLISYYTIGVFDFKRLCTEWSVYDIKVP